MRSVGKVVQFTVSRLVPWVVLVVAVLVMAEGEYGLVVHDCCRKSMVHLSGLFGRSWSAVGLLLSGWALGWEMSSVFSTGRDGYLFFFFFFRRYYSRILACAELFLVCLLLDITAARSCRYRGSVTTMHDYVCVESWQAMREPREVCTGRLDRWGRHPNPAHSTRERDSHVQSAASGAICVAEPGRMTVLPLVNSEHGGQQPAADESGSKDSRACELRCLSAMAIPACLP